MIDGKAWGTTELLINTPLFAMHRLEIMAGGFCSWHKHNHKHNAFLVLAGELIVEVEKSDYELLDTTVLSQDQMTTVKPGDWHRFRTEVVCVALEIYYCEPLSSDIVRRDHGGLGINESKLRASRADPTAHR